MDQSDRTAIEESSTQRAAFYRFLASIFLYELTPAQIEELARLEVPAGDDHICTGYATIHEYLRHRDSGTRQKLAVDYARVFLGAGNYETITAPPYESVYTSPERILMQEARDGAVKHYRRQGLRLPEDNTTPEDHAGFELQFMAELIERTSKAASEGDDARFAELVAEQRAFYDEHMANWMGAFADDIDEHCRTDFYHGIAELLRGLLEVEGELIGELGTIVSEES